VAIVVFGLPPNFHEDNSARGINLGFRLLRKGVQVALHTPHVQMPLLLQ
jgi:hypothetical protein